MAGLPRHPAWSKLVAIRRRLLTRNDSRKAAGACRSNGRGGKERTGGEDGICSAARQAGRNGTADSKTFPVNPARGERVAAVARSAIRQPVLPARSGNHRRRKKLSEAVHRPGGRRDAISHSTRWAASRSY